MAHCPLQCFTCHGTYFHKRPSLTVISIAIAKKGISILELAKTWQQHVQVQVLISNEERCTPKHYAAGARDMP